MVASSNNFASNDAMWYNNCLKLAPVQSMCSPLFSFMQTQLMKAPRSKRREVFSSILDSCYTTLDAKLSINNYYKLMARLELEPISQV